MDSRPPRKNRDRRSGPVWDESAGAWLVDITYPNGKRHRKWFPRRRKAQRYWNTETARLDDGAVTVRELTVGEGFDEYRKYSEKHHKSYEPFIEPNLVALEKRLGRETKLPSVVKADIERAHLERAEHLSKTTADKLVQVAKAAWNWFIGQGYATTNPVRGVKQFAVNNEITNYLRRNQYPAVLQAAELGPPYLKPLIIVAANTGLRRGNVLRLRWSEIDTTANVIRIANETKNNKTVVVPLNANTKEALNSIPRMGEFVFMNPETGTHITDVKNPFATCLRRAQDILREAGLDDEAKALASFRFHDLRHTAASWLAMGGAGLPTIQKFMNHASIKMTLRYAHLSPDFLGEEARILDRMLPNSCQVVSTKTGKEQHKPATRNNKQLAEQKGEKHKQARPRKHRQEPAEQAVNRRVPGSSPG